jgi:hypothetical protein
MVTMCTTWCVIRHPCILPCSVYIYYAHVHIILITRQCTDNVISRHVCESLLPWKSNVLHICVCAQVRACMWVPGRVGVCMRMHACSLVNPARNAYAPYCDVICFAPRSPLYFWTYVFNGAIFGKKLFNISLPF